MSDRQVTETDVCGILLLDKPEGITSSGILSVVKRLFMTRAAGHAGTLDPMATGLLIVMLGRACKLSEYMLEADKRYSCIMKLGVVSDTEDIWGKVSATGVPLPAEAEVLEAAVSFRGDIMQVPPMYSALKRGGVKLVDMARRGVVTEREPRPVSVKALDVWRISGDEYALDVVCSKGTYIRTLCADIGKKLGCGAVMKQLRRTAAHGFTLDRAVTVKELEDMTFERRIERLIAPEDALPELRRIMLPAFYANLARNGNEIYLDRAGVEAETGEYVLLFDAKGFFSVARCLEYPDGKALKPEKQIRLDI